MYTTSEVVNLLLVAENVTESGLASIHIDDGSVGILHGTLLDPSADVLLCGQLEHLADLARRADEGAAELDALEDQSRGGDREGTILGDTELNESTVAVEQLDVVGDGHLRRSAIYSTVVREMDAKRHTLEEETVEMIKSREREFFWAHSESSSVAM